MMLRTVCCPDLLLDGFVAAWRAILPSLAMVKVTGFLLVCGLVFSIISNVVYQYPGHISTRDSFSWHFQPSTSTRDYSLHYVF